MNEFSCKCINGFSTISACPSSSYYETITGRCYYFENSKMNYQQAQISCRQKFGSYYSGRLVEPMSIEIGKALVTKAKALNVIGSGNHAVWIGYDQIGRGNGDFKYASTGLKSPLESVTSAGNFDGDNGNANCITLEYHSVNGGHLDDESCAYTFKSICEGEPLKDLIVSTCFKYKSI